MKVSSIALHNFRSVANGTFSLGDYSLLIGANNSGKSNVIDALRIFYEKGIKFEEDRDFPKFQVTDNESWLDIEYILTDEEYAGLKDEYKRPNNHIKVRKYLKTKEKGPEGKVKQGIYAYVEDKISDEHFYGAKNVQQGKFGDIIYIQAVSRLDEHTKLSGPSPLRDLLNEILTKLVKSSSSFQKLVSEFEGFAKEIKNEETPDKRSLSGLEKEINENIEEWDATFGLKISPVSESDIVKNLVSFDIIDRALGTGMEAKQFGQGFQRHLIFVLLQLAAKYQTGSVKKDRKEFIPDLTLILFEEPEAFLHPPQQNVLCRSLQKISSASDSQVLLSSHSVHFVSQNSDDIPSIVRLEREGAKTNISQITREKLTEIFLKNLDINALLENTKYKVGTDDLKEDMEAVKYFLWLNPDRCGLFFAKHVLLVEGASEKVIINYLLNTGQIEMPRGGVFVLDALGKFNIHRFMNLLGNLGISHSVLFDTDSNEKAHSKISELIHNSRNSYTRKIENISGEIEDFLGIKKAGSPHRKPQHVMFNLKEGKIEPKYIEKFILLVNTLISC